MQFLYFFFKIYFFSFGFSNFNPIKSFYNSERLFSNFQNLFFRVLFKYFVSMFSFGCFRFFILQKKKVVISKVILCDFMESYVALKLNFQNLLKIIKYFFIFLFFIYKKDNWILSKNKEKLSEENKNKTKRVHVFVKDI